MHLKAGLSTSGWLAVLLLFVLAHLFAQGAQMRERLDVERGKDAASFGAICEKNLVYQRLAPSEKVTGNIGVGSDRVRKFRLTLADLFALLRRMKIIFDFKDTEGQWTHEKRQTATDEIKERCYRVGFRGEPEIVFPAPQAQPNARGVGTGGKTVFRYTPFAEIPDAS